MNNIPANVVAAFAMFPDGGSQEVIETYVWANLARGWNNNDAELSIEQVPPRRGEGKRIHISFWRRGKCVRSLDYVQGDGIYTVKQ